MGKPHHKLDVWKKSIDLVESGLGKDGKGASELKKALKNLGIDPTTVSLDKLKKESASVEDKQKSLKTKIGAV